MAPHCIAWHRMQLFDCLFSIFSRKFGAYLEIFGQWKAKFIKYNIPKLLENLTRKPK